MLKEIASLQAKTDKLLNFICLNGAVATSSTDGQDSSGRKVNVFAQLTAYFPMNTVHEIEEFENKLKTDEKFMNNFVSLIFDL